MLAPQKVITRITRKKNTQSVVRIQPTMTPTNAGVFTMFAFLTGKEQRDQELIRRWGLES